ncbi:MAG TPA: histidine phosphatase family protein [Rhizomicrobium sp.]|nr:histidine phosphatase family protein [Rhizomicrobium sp.]
MKRLLIFRHAKAGPHDEAHDKQRGLVERGRNDAALMGRALRDRGYLPDVVLCSSAKRTMETWEHAEPMLGTNPETRFLDELYNAPEKSILKTIRSVKENAPVLMCIGHNPGLENLARKLARNSGSDAERKRMAAMEKKFPTGAVAVLDFQVNAWSDIDSGKGALTAFLVPADFKPK